MQQKPEIKVSNYIIGNSIGKGSFGSVYYCVHKETKMEYAIKALSKSALQKQAIFQTGEDDPDEINNQLTQLYHEIKFMRENVHPCLIRLVDYIEFPQQDHIYIILEIAEGVLASIYSDKSRCPVPGGQLSKFPELQNLACLVMSYTQPLTLLHQMMQVSLGLWYLHSNDYVHADLKHANILRLNDGRYVLADLGMTQKEEQGKLYNQAVSTAYSSPDQQGLTKQNDVWAFGVIFFMNLMGYHPAALVINYCLQHNIPYQQSHWGLFIQEHFDDVQKFYQQLIDKTVKYWEMEFSLLQKLYQVQLEYNSTRSFITVLGSIIFSCFKPYQTRPTILEISKSIGQLYVMYYGQKIQKLCQHNQNVEQTLNDILDKLNIHNVQEVLFFVFLSDYRQHKEIYLKQLDQIDIQYQQINFNVFPDKSHIYSSNQEPSLMDSQSIYSQKLPSKVLENNALLQQYTSVIEKSLMPNSIFEPSESINYVSKLELLDNQLISVHNDSNTFGIQRSQFEFSNSIDMLDDTESTRHGFGQKIASTSHSEIPPNPKRLRSNSNIKSSSEIVGIQRNKYSGIALNLTPCGKHDLQLISESNAFPKNQSRTQSATLVLEKLKRKQQQQCQGKFDLTMSNFISESIGMASAEESKLYNKAVSQQESISDFSPPSNQLVSSFETPPAIPNPQNIGILRLQLDKYSDNRQKSVDPIKQQQSNKSIQKESNEIQNHSHSKLNQESIKHSSFDDEHVEEISDNVISIQSSSSSFQQPQQKDQPENDLSTSNNDHESQIQYIETESSDMISQAGDANAAQCTQVNRLTINQDNNSNDSTDFTVKHTSKMQNNRNNQVTEAMSPITNTLAAGANNNQRLFSNVNSSSSDVILTDTVQQNNNNIKKTNNKIVQEDICELMTPLSARYNVMSSANLLAPVPEQSIRISKSTNNLKSVELQQKYPGLKFQRSKVGMLTDMLGLNQQQNSNSENTSDDYVYIMPAKPKNLAQDIRKPKPQKETNQQTDQKKDTSGGMTARNLTVKQTHLVENDELFYQNEDVQKLHDYKVSLSARSNNTNTTQEVDNNSMQIQNSFNEIKIKHSSSFKQNADKNDGTDQSSGLLSDITQKHALEQSPRQLEETQAQQLSKFCKSNTLNLFNVEFLGLTQRSNYFMRLDLHYKDSIQIFKEQTKVGTLFKNVAYVKDKSLDFKYDRKQDQNHIMNLGSFDDVNNMSGGAQMDHQSDSDILSSDDDELIEIGGDDDTVDEILNLYTDVEERDIEKYKVNGLIAHGKGKFNTLMEIDDSNGKSAESQYSIFKQAKEDSTKIAYPQSEPSSARIGENELGIGHQRQKIHANEQEQLPVPKFLAKPPIRCIPGQHFELPREEPNSSSQNTALKVPIKSNQNSCSQFGLMSVIGSMAEQDSRTNESPRRKRLNTAATIKSNCKSRKDSLQRELRENLEKDVDFNLTSTHQNTASWNDSSSDDSGSTDDSETSTSEGDFIGHAPQQRPATAPNVTSMPHLEALSQSSINNLKTNISSLNSGQMSLQLPVTTGNQAPSIPICPSASSNNAIELEKAFPSLELNALPLSKPYDSNTSVNHGNQNTALNLPVRPLALPTEDERLAEQKRLHDLDIKYQLFDDEYNQELKAQHMDQRLTARLTARGGFRGGVPQIDMQQGPISVRQEIRGQNPESADLTDMQAIVFFHHAIVLFNMADFYIQKWKKQVYQLQEYKEAAENFITPIQQTQNNIPQLRPQSLEDLILNYQLWLDVSMKYVQNPFMRQCSTILQRIKLAIDTQPAFLRRECGWILQNSFQLYKELHSIFEIVNSSQDSEYGINLYINGQRLLFSPKQENHDIHIYVGLEMVESSPVVGVRHKSALRTLVVQTCDRYLQFQKGSKELQYEQTKAQSILLQHESYTNPRAKYFAFKFTNLVTQGDYDQYERKGVLYNLLFVSLNKQVMMPLLLVEVLVDLLFNARKFSKPSVIRASIFDYENNFYMIVSDAGCGLAEEKTQITFTKPKLIPGQRDPGEYSRDFGNGSGISKAKLIVGFYGGVINVSSIDGGGTKIIVKIPMSRPDPEHIT